MEDRRPDQDDSESWHPSTETARPSFLASWLRRRQESFLGTQERDTSPEEDDDDEESESTLPKRFRRFFRRVFNQIVEPVEQSTERAPQHFGLPFNIESVASASTATTMETSVDTAVDMPALSQTREADQPIVVDTTTNQLEHAPNLSPESYQRPLFTQADSLPGEPSQQYIERPQPSREVRQGSTQTVVERQEVQANSGATMALLGAEFFARRRADRKIERKLTNEIETLEQQVGAGNNAQVRLEKRVTAQAEQKTPASVVDQSSWSVRPERSQPSVENKTNTWNRPAVQTHEQAQPRIEQIPQPKNPELHIPNSERPLSIEKTEPSPQSTSEIFKSAIEVPEKQIKPRAVLEKVVEAAEHNAPLERAYERRQEIKDDTSGPSTPGGASAVGEILARSAPATPPPALSYSEHVTRQAAQKSPHDDPQLYQVAIANGVRAAAVVIVFAVLAYVLAG